MKPDGGTITSPKGFLAGAVSAGLRSREGLDLALLFSEAPCVAAGVFTTNRIKAAPVVVSRSNLRRGRARAVVVNAGCANACTGERGLGDAREMASLAARKLGVAQGAVVVASTGVIGQFLAMEKIQQGLERVSLSPEGGHELARSIMTTDTFPKEIAISEEVGGAAFTIGGVAKGAGMLHPDLATMLCFLTTDAAVEPGFLKQCLKRAVDISFNMITIDGDTSPNDMVIILANGLAGNEPLREGMAEASIFQKALDEVCVYLARSIARDGEGATRLIEVKIEGAVDEAQARKAARTIAGSNLVKAAVYGADPNWGRIIAALGRSGARIEEGKIDLYLDQLPLMAQGSPVAFNKGQARAILRQKEVGICVNLHLGPASATAWGCDLSPGYVKINSAYTT